MERETKQRKAIFRVLEEQGRPLTVEEIHRHGREYVPRLGLTTVYRSVRAMIRSGILLGLQYPGQPVRYEAPSRSEHIHFICNACGKLYDLPSSHKEKSMDLPPGFVVEGEELIVFGRCADCAGIREG